MTLQVLIATFGQAGLDRVAFMTLPALDEVSYLVTVQNPDGAPLALPPGLQRPDLKVIGHPTRGLSINRNFGLDNATGDILLIADDDLHYTPDGLRNVLKVFTEHPGLDFATFRYTGADAKFYPGESFVFSLPYPKNFYLTSFELAIRRASLPRGLRFSPDYGIGAPVFGAGEEDLFLMGMIRSGMHGRFFPVDIVSHPGLTTGSREATPAVLRAQGAIIRHHHGGLPGLLRVIYDARRRRAPMLTALKYMLSGFFKAR